MKIFFVKMSSERPRIILLATHYDTKKLEQFCRSRRPRFLHAVTPEGLRGLLCPLSTAGISLDPLSSTGRKPSITKWKDPR